MKNAPRPDSKFNSIILLAWPMIRLTVISIVKDSLSCTISHHHGSLLDKPGKPNYFLSSSWRTLNLFISLTDTCQADIQLDDNQLGFRKCYSCDEALHKLVSCVEIALFNNIIAVGSFIDKLI